MRSSYCAVLLTALASSCAHVGAGEIFSSPQAGRTLQLSGYISTESEGIGLYPRPDLTLKAGEQCLFIDPDEIERRGWRHRQYVHFTGRLRETLCGERGYVCFQGCRDYAIVQVNREL